MMKFTQMRVAAAAVAIAIALAPAPSFGAGGGTFDITSTGNSLSCTSTANAITVPVEGRGVVGWNVTGLTACGATLIFEGQTGNGTGFTSVNAVTATADNPSPTITADGSYKINAAGFSAVRLRVSVASGSGSATVAYVASAEASYDGLSLPLPTGANTIGSVSQNGTWTVQPGNTANTTAWLTNLSIFLQATGTLTPGSGSAPDSNQACHEVKTSAGVMLSAEMISPSMQPTGSTLEFYDEAGPSPSCLGADRIYSSGQVGAGWLYPALMTGPLVYSNGLAFQIVSGTAFGTNYGMRFRTLP